MARPEMDVCYSAMTQAVLDSERYYKMSVDGVGDIPLGGILDMVKSGNYCWIGLGGP